MEIVNEILGWVIIVGTFITYGFQYQKLYENKNVVGISDNMLIMGCISSLLNFLGILTSSFDNLSDYSGYNLYYEVLPIIQLASPLLCLEINYIMFYIYNRCPVQNHKFRVFNGIQFFFTFLIYPILMACITEHYDIFSNILNIASAIFSVLMWIPQINTTLMFENEGTLSLLSLGFHAMGCLLVIVFQLLEQEPFTTILPYIIALGCEGWIVGYCIYKKYVRDRDEPLLNNIYTITETVYD